MLSFAAPGQTLATDLVPGTEFRGDLTFYPGAAPLRALVAERDSAAEPFGAPEGAADSSSALAGWSATVAAEPWRYDAPVLLAGVGADRRRLAGRRAPAPRSRWPPGHREPWWLLAAAGAAPGHRGRRVVARRVCVRSPPGSTAATFRRPRRCPIRARRGSPELPPEMLAAALVGTNRRPWARAVVAAGVGGGRPRLRAAPA